MDNTMLIQLTNQKATGLLHELEELNLIKILQQNIGDEKTNLSDKYRGVFSRKDAENFTEYTKTSRHEWDNT